MLLEVSDRKGPSESVDLEVGPEVQKTEVDRWIDRAGPFREVILPRVEVAGQRVARIGRMPTEVNVSGGWGQTADKSRAALLNDRTVYGDERAVVKLELDNRSGEASTAGSSKVSKGRPAPSRVQG